MVCFFGWSREEFFFCFFVHLASPILLFISFACPKETNQRKGQKIYSEPSHRPLPDTDIFSGQRTLFLRNNKRFSLVILRSTFWIFFIFFITFLPVQKSNQKRTFLAKAIPPGGGPRSATTPIALQASPSCLLSLLLRLKRLVSAKQ